MMECVKNIWRRVLGNPESSKQYLKRISEEFRRIQLTY